MIKLLARFLATISRCFYVGFVTVDEAIFSFLPLPDADGSATSDADMERIRESLLRIRRDLEQLPVGQLIDDFVVLLDQAFGGPEGFVRTVRGWADLVDSLVLETEREFSSQSGRGRLKKRTVKGAMLYMMSRSEIDLPKVPSFMEPIVWDMFFDAFIDVIAQLINRHDLWEDVPTRPSFRARVSLGAQRAGSSLENLVRWLTKLSWAVVFAASPVSPRIKKAVDGFLLVNPQPVQSAVLVAAWFMNHAQSLVIVSDLISVMVVEAETFINADEAERKAYARDLTLAFIQQETGSPAPGTLSYKLLGTMVDVAVEVVVMLFEKHRFLPARTPVLALPAAAVH